jgi:hypothetical protein
MFDLFGIRKRREARHTEEHRACEHLDGAVPFVRCSCGETFGYDQAPGWWERFTEEAKAL